MMYHKTGTMQNLAKKKKISQINTSQIITNHHSTYIYKAPMLSFFSLSKDHELELLGKYLAWV